MTTVALLEGMGVGMRAGTVGQDGGAAGPAVTGSPRGQRAIRVRLLRSGRCLFEERGYYETTTKDICEQAQTTEATLFRNFGSKAGLFEATVVEPFAAFMTEWKESLFAAPVDMPLPDFAQQWVRDLVGFMYDNRSLLRLLIGADCSGDPDLQPIAHRISTQFAEGIQDLLNGGATEVVRARHHVDLPDPYISMAAEVSMVLGMIVLTDWVLVGSDGPPPRDRVIKEVTDMLLGGVVHRS